MTEDLGDNGMAEGLNTIARHTFTRERQSQALPDYYTISLIRHPSKIMLRVVFNQLKTKAEELLA